MKQKQSIKRIQRFLDEIEWLFGVQNFEKHITLKNEDRDGVASEINYEKEYQRITIYIYPTFFRSSLDDQRKYLLHELCHIITLQSKNLAYKINDGKVVTFEEIRAENEEMTSKIENLLNGLLQDKLQYAKKAYRNYLKKMV